MLKYLFRFTMCLFVFNVNASVITFDPPPLPTGSRLVSDYTENGVSFTGSFAHSSTDSGRVWNDSTGYLAFLYGSSLRIEMLNSSLFSLGAIDLAEYSSVFREPRTITFTGYYSSGLSVSQSFTIDGLFDGVGGIDDFETFSFGTEFRNLAYVELNTVIFSMDNLEINAVPIPAAAWLFSSGVIALLGIARRKKA